MMPDYNEHNLTPLDPLHHVEGLVSLSDRVARRKKEQQRRQQQKRRQYDEEPNGSDVPGEKTAPAAKEDEHIDFRA